MNSIRAFFRRWAATLRPLPAIKRPLSYSRLTLADWRSSPERVAYVAELLRTPLFLDLVGMLANVRPSAPGALDSTMAATLLGQRIGHDQIIATLLKAGTHEASAPLDLTADYAPENTMAAWEQEGN